MGKAKADLLVSDSDIAPDVQALSGDDLPPPAEPAAAAYELPTWAEFRGFVMDNGDKYVRASYPNAPTDLIETIWSGVPVLEHEQARVMSPAGEWLVY